MFSFGRLDFVTLIRARNYPSLILAVLMVTRCQAQDAVFRSSRIFILSGNQETKVTLTLSDGSIAIQSKQADRLIEQITYSSISKMSYEGVSHHHLSQGFATATLSMGVGAIVAATKAEDHWLKVDYDRSTV